MDFRPLDDLERRQLLKALRGNAGGENCAIFMNPQDTTFAGSGEVAVTDDEVISAIKAVPCHYQESSSDERGND